MSNITKIMLGITAISLLNFSLLVMPASAASMYAYVTASPVAVENGQSTTITVIGYLYGSGTYEINVAFWDSDKFEDIKSTDDSAGSCKTSVTITVAGSFKCSYDVIPSEFMKGNIEDEADWVEFYAIVTTKGVESYNTGQFLVYCNWCNAEALGPGPQK